MARERVLTIRNPTAGVVRRFAHQDQPPFSLIDALNFLPFDAKTGQRRLSLRPRLVALGSGLNSAVRGIYTVNSATNQQFPRGLFAMSGGVLYRWNASNWVSEGGSFPTTSYLPGSAFLDSLYLTGESKLQVYDCTADTLGSLSESAGTSPANPTNVVTWNDRLVVTTGTHVWYMSKSGDPTNWEYGQNNRTTAVAADNMDDGQFGERIMAMVPHNRDCLLFGGTDSWHVLRGDPARQGQLHEIADVVGCLGPAAWCRTDDDQTVMLARNGVYAMPPGCGTTPVPMSRERIPNSLVGIDTDTYETFLGFDSRFNGVMIFLTGTSSREAWWYDWDEGGYWPLEFTTTEQARSLCRFDPLDAFNKSGLLIGGAGGGVRQFDRTDTSNIASGRVRIGPFRISPTPLHESIIQEMHITFGGNTTDTAAVVKVFCERDAESAWDACVADAEERTYETTLEKLQDNWAVQPRVGGHSCIIEIELATQSAHISIEEIVLRTRETGRQRP